MESRTSNRPEGSSIEVALRAMCAAALMAAAIVVVLVLRVGPVLVTLAPGRGIHLGDSLGIASAAAAAWLFAPSVHTPTHQLLSGVVRGIRA